MTDILTILRTSAVIPVLVIHDAGQARGLAEALVAGGLKVLEVTMRTPAALDVIREMKLVPGAIVGAGTVISTGRVRRRQLGDGRHAVGDRAEGARRGGAAGMTGRQERRLTSNGGHCPIAVRGRQ